LPTSNTILMHSIRIFYFPKLSKVYFEKFWEIKNHKKQRFLRDCICRSGLSRDQ